MIEAEERDFALEENRIEAAKRHMQILNVMVGKLLVENQITEPQQDELNYYCRKLGDIKQVLRRNSQ